MKQIRSKFYQVLLNFFIKQLIFLFLGLENELTLGTPIGFIIQNQDVLKQDYSGFNIIPRPGHADFTYLMKYGVKAESGGGLIHKKQ